MIPHLQILVATDENVLSVDARKGPVMPAEGLGERRPGCLALDPWVEGRAWCGTTDDGVFRSDDGGLTWRATGLRGEAVTAISSSPAEGGLIWAGTEPSAVWRSSDAGRSWDEAPGLEDLPSSSEWSFPPRPDTHHVRWIACHPADANRLWVAIEAGALVTTVERGEAWEDRVPGGPRDTHEIAIHPDRPDTLRVSAGDSYFESGDGGRSWQEPGEGLDVTYLRSVAVDPGDPDTVIVSAASRPRAAYVAGRSDGRLYRRVAGGSWERITEGWPDPPATIAPLVRPGTGEGEFWAADERGVHRSNDAGVTWRRVAVFDPAPAHLRGFAVGSAGD